MGIESATYISSLVSTNPLGSDQANEGDNHLRLIKSVLMSTFPNMDAAFYKPKVATKTANYTLLVTDDNQVINLDSATTKTLTLPNSGTIAAGWSCKVICAQLPSTAHSIARNATPGTDTINSASSVPFTYAYEGFEIYYIGSGKFLTLQHSFYNSVLWNANNDASNIRWLELLYSASSPTVTATAINMASALLGSDYFLRTKDNAGNLRYLKRPTVQRFTASGTWTKPAGCTAIDIVVVGGGGAGGGAPATAAGQSSGGGSGGGGEVAYKWGITSASSTETVTIGAAGAGASGSAGGNGGNSSFGAHASANGGTGGAVLTASASVAFSSGGGLGGTGGTGGDLHVPGEPGGKVVRNSATSCEVDNGGGCAFGSGGRGFASGVAATAGLGRGGGGGGETNGASASAQAGKDGTAGFVLVTEYYD